MPRTNSSSQNMILQVVGGTYKEFCEHPSWSELYGSGLRAAITARAYCKKVQFSTYIGTKDAGTLDVKAGEAQIDLHYETIPETVSFSYFHGLSTPNITPIPMPKGKTQTVQGESILRFGMLEGDANVDGERVVYDPQSPHSPLNFQQNGSKAKQLAIVCNRREASILTGKSDYWRQARTLLQNQNASVIVIKMGSHGCFVATRKSSWKIPAFKTNRVWPVGSGDVFSAVFACLWAVQRCPAHVAARQASLEVANYCESNYLPEKPLKTIPKHFKPISPRSKGGSPVYLAGPFFTPSESWMINEARGCLIDSGVSVFSPLHNVGRGSAEDVYEKDIQGLKKSGVVLACIESIDAGTLFEIGYAVALGKKVIAFVYNQREEDLKMLRGSGCDIVDDFCTAIYKTAWAALDV